MPVDSVVPADAHVQESDKDVGVDSKKKKKLSLTPSSALPDSEFGDDLLELLGEVVEEHQPSPPTSDEEEDEVEYEEESCEEEEGEEEGWKDDDVSVISETAHERRYVVGSESFEHLKDPGLRHAYELVEKVPKKICRQGIAGELTDYKTFCEEFGVVPCEKFMRNIHNAVMDLSYMGLNQQGVQAVCKGLMDNLHVKKLILRGNDCSGEAGEALAELLETNYTIEHLNIARTNIVKCLKRICEALKANVGVVVLDLSRNDITDKEIRSLNMVLSESALKELYLSRNYIVDEGLQYLVRGIEDNTTLEVLDLAYNRLWGGKESLPFFAALGKLETLKTLDLQGNSIKDPAGKVIARLMVGKKANLEWLNVSFNLLTNHTCADFGKGFAQSKVTETLIAGPNRWNVGPLTQGYLAPMLGPMTGAKANPVAKLLDVSYITPIHSEFMKPLKTLEKRRPDLKIIHGEPFGFNEGTRPDPQALLIRRAKVVCENFATPLSMLINELRTEPPTLTAKKFKKFIKSCNLYKDKKMTKEFILNFPAKGGLEVDCKGIIEAYDKEYPNEKGTQPEKMVAGVDSDLVSNAPQHMEQLLKW